MSVCADGRPAVIAIDGPGGSGKSTVSAEVARRLEWAHLDTGAYYRAATLAALRAGVDPDDVAGLLDVITPSTMVLEDGVMRLDGEDVSEEIRSDEVTAAVSTVAAHGPVRSLMVALQRRWVADHGTKAVVEGRDIGTVVFPRAELKIFLTASPDERARRRARQVGTVAGTVEADLERRDRLDSSRAASPLQPAADAIVLDTTGLGIDEVVDQVIEQYRRVAGEAG